jgi:hypothetical protein
MTTTPAEPNTTVAARYHGIPASQIKPVFKAACASRHAGPDVADIIEATRTTLPPAIVSAILDGALRLLPVDTSAEGKKVRREEQQARARRAQHAEDEFVAAVRRFQPAMLDEAQRRRRAASVATPDVLFPGPTEFAGEMCRWVEYKDMFGFKANPFVQAKIREQCRRYASLFGPGMIVYRLGFETGLLGGIEGVHVAREREVCLWIGRQRSI